jgi:predicted DNA-binding transcriptional regulator AlpA
MATSASGQPSLLTTPAAGVYTGFSKSTLEKLRCAGKGPRYIKLGGQVRYRPTDLDDWLKSGVVETEDSRRQQARP